MLEGQLIFIVIQQKKTILDAKQNIKIVEPVEEEKPKKAAKESSKIKAKKDSENKEEALKN